MKKLLIVLMLVAMASFLFVGCFPPPTNQTPIITSDPITAATVGVLYTYDVNATDPDGDTLTYSLAIKPTGMTINPANGLIKWTPAAAQIGNNSVTVKVSDGSLSITQGFIIKVSTLPPVNQKPVITSSPNLTATVGVTYVYDVNATDPNGDTLTYSLTTKPSGMFINSVNGLIWWTPIAKGTYTVVVKVSDGFLIDTQGFNIVVSKPTVPPETYTITAYAGPGGSISPLGDVTVNSGSDRLFIITPDALYSIEKVLVDGGSVGAVNTYTFNNVAKDHTIHATFSTVEAVNQAPTITSIPITTAILGVEYIYDVDATDPDGDVLTYSLTTKPGGMAINPGTGVVSWIPTAEGSYGIAVEVSDGELSDSQSFEIIVSTVEITKIEVDPKTMTLYEGGSETIISVTATYEIKKGFEAPIALGDCTYLSDDVLVATVDNGVITAVVEGTTTIYVNYAGETDSILVTVLLPLEKPVHNITKDEYYTTIQSAIDFPASPGDTIEVATGIYDEAITIGIENLTLQSETWLGAIIKPTSSGKNAIYISADGVTIDGFEIDGTTLCKNGILGWETSGLTIKNNKIHGAINAWDGCGILLFSWGNGGTVYNNLIENNEVYDTGRMGIMVMDRGADYSVTSGNTITGNIVHDVWKVPMGDHGGGIQINVGKDCAITNNKIYDVQNGQRGIYMFGSASGNTITGNTIRDSEIGVQLWISGEGGTPIVWGGETATSPEVHYNNIYNNSSYGAISSNLEGTTLMVMDATNNWWGSELGPKYEGFPALGGDAVSANVDYSNWSTSSN